MTTKTHVTEKHLKNGHHYFVSVFAVNEAGQSAFSTFHRGSPAPSISVKGSHHGLKLKGLSAGTPYHVVITARNSLGAGTSSRPVTGTPAA